MASIEPRDRQCPWAGHPTVHERQRIPEKIQKKGSANTTEYWFKAVVSYVERTKHLPTMTGILVTIDKKGQS